MSDCLSAVESSILSCGEVVSRECLESFLWKLEADHPNITKFRALVVSLHPQHPDYLGGLVENQFWWFREILGNSPYRYRFEDLVTTVLYQQPSKSFGAELRLAQLQRALDYEDTTLDEV